MAIVRAPAWLNGAGALAIIISIARHAFHFHFQSHFYFFFYCIVSYSNVGCGSGKQVINHTSALRLERLNEGISLCAFQYIGDYMIKKLKIIVAAKINLLPRRSFLSCLIDFYITIIFIMGFIYIIYLIYVSRVFKTETKKKQTLTKPKPCADGLLYWKSD
jgi:hypothetical protein